MPCFDAFAEVAKALAHGRRAEIIDVLAQGERLVEEMAVARPSVATRPTTCAPSPVGASPHPT